MSATRCQSSPEPQRSGRTPLSLPGALRSSFRKHRTSRFCVVKNGAKIDAVYRQTGKQLPRCWVFLCQSLAHTKVLAKRCSMDFSPKSDQPLLGPTRSKEGVCRVSCHGLSGSSGDVGVHGRSHSARELREQGAFPAPAVGGDGQESILTMTTRTCSSGQLGVSPLGNPTGTFQCV